MALQTSILSRLTQLIESNKLYIVDGTLNRNLLAANARRYDPGLLNLLQQDDEIKTHFFSVTDGGLIFKKDVFLQFITNKEFLPDSYTKYKIKIGLGAENGSLLSENGDVVLNWPYKDALLEGGQDKEDQKRNEVFFNEILAPDQITRILDDKVFTDWKRYDENGTQDLDELKDDDNLIIRGNNLVVLHSLMKRYAGKVKLIYIDPPYNTDGDSFNYNDSFNHSTWLTFMRNRLEVAKKLLAEDGIIFVQIDYIEFAYLKVLMDEVFGTNKALPHVTVKTATPAGFKVVNPGFINVSEQILIYVKSRKDVIKNGYTPSEYQSDYSKYITNKSAPANQWNIVNIKEAALKAAGYSGMPALNEAVGLGIAKHILNELVSKFAIENADSVFATYSPHKPSKNLQLAIAESKENEDVVLEFNRNNESSYYLLNGRLLAFYSSKMKNIDGRPSPTQRLTDFWSDMSWDSLSSEGGVTLKNGKKPERLLKRIIELTTNPGDLVLDYHVGSGTTAAVAHKMSRQYIGVEQLNYGKDDATVRLLNVINGEASGISKLVNWKGGGSFVYASIMDNANKFRERVKAATSDKDYLILLKEAASSSFLSYRVDPKKLNEDEFRKLSSVEKRHLLLELIDNNTLYVNYEDINDPSFKISEKDKEFNKKLYEKNS